MRTTRFGTAATQRLSTRLLGRHRRDELARDLATYDSPADLLELSAMFARYPDAQTEDVRPLVNWSRAA